MKRFSRVPDRVLVTGVLVVLGLVGCGEDASPPPVTAITGLHFTATTELPSNPPPDVDITLTDPTPSRAIYAATLALPGFPPGTYNCPQDSGIRYAIVLKGAQGDALSATLNPAGCSDVTIQSLSTRRVLDPAYWASLAQNLGIEEATIYPPTLP